MTLLQRASSSVALGALLFGLSTSSIAQSSDVELNSYRIDTNDCPTCGFVDIQSQEDLANHLNEMRSILSDGAGPYGSFQQGNGSTGDDDPQVIFLDFDAGGDPVFPVCNADGTVFGIFEDHVYTQEERDTITARVAADYADFNYVITQTQPSSGEFTTIFIGENDAPLDCSAGSNVSITAAGGVNILFGQAEGIDFLNRNRSDNAFADASVWAFLSQFAGGAFFEAFSGVPLAAFGGDLEAATSFAVVNQTANTTAHEAGHIQGLRHQNSFGAPGDGLPSTGAISPLEFVPAFDGPSNATETVLHTMASGASVGLGLTGSTITDRFFSERSASRLAINTDASIVSEDSLNSDRQINLGPINVPNTIIEGVNQGAELETEALVVTGTIGSFGEVDSYNFRGRAGEFFNAELISAGVSGFDFVEGILGRLDLFLVADDGSETLVASNSRSFESLFDTEIFDAVLPETGNYRVQISAPDAVFFTDITGDGLITAEDELPLTLVGGGDLLVGSYEAQFYTCNKELDSTADVANAALAFDFLETFNLIVLDDLMTNVNIQGRTFVGGDLSGNSATFGSNIRDRSDVLIVAGDISGNPKNINNGGGVVYGGELTARLNLNGNGNAVNDPTISTVEAENALIGLSNDLALIEPNSYIHLPTGQPGAARLVAYPDANGTAVFYLEDGNDLLSNNRVNQIELVTNGATNIVVNLGGTNIKFDRGNFVGNLNNQNLADNIIWNFPEALSLRLQRSMNGAILAPEASFKNQTQVRGSVVVASVNSAGSIQNSGFSDEGISATLGE